ncbi:MAG: DNA polymerase III subunit delta' [Candidimonas sp.]|nr:MAG: DNA polymerase III subunit delta' [Candidimonas sp.]TAM26168.1 MAG: DNA polymerase III subunit delta' [Candidimonas sp.]
MSAISRFLPWQEDLARSWLGQRERFAHAWLIHGVSGIGKRQFALAAAASLLCEAPVQGLACGQCAACHWLAANNHPDLRRIRPDAIAQDEGAEAVAQEDAMAPTAKKTPSKEIRVDQLRALSSWFNTATHRGGWRVAVLYPAHALNSISANALLKVLEEPPEHTVFLLVAEAPDRLLPTLVSRCRRLPLASPPARVCVEWLQGQGLDAPESWLAAAGGAPLSALQLAQSGAAACPDWLCQLVDPLARAQSPEIGNLADGLEKELPSVWIDTLQRLFVDLLLAASGAPIRYFPSIGEKIRAAAARASLANLSDTGKWLGQQRAVADHPLNAKLLVHSVLQRVALACLPAR